MDISTSRLTAIDTRDWEENSTPPNTLFTKLSTPEGCKNLNAIKFKPIALLLIEVLYQVASGGRKSNTLMGDRSVVLTRTAKVFKAVFYLYLQRSAHRVLGKEAIFLHLRSGLCQVSMSTGELLLKHRQLLICASLFLQTPSLRLPSLSLTARMRSWGPNQVFL